MVHSNNDIRVSKFERACQIIWCSLLVVPMIIAAFIVALPMGLAMVGVLLLLSFKKQ